VLVKKQAIPACFGIKYNFNMSKEKASLSIQRLRCPTIIGVYAHEKKQAQPLFVSLSCTLDISKASKSDNLAHTLDYAALCTFVKQYCKQSKVELIESLIVQLKTELETQFQCDDLQLIIEKPDAIQDCQSVSLTL